MTNAIAKGTIKFEDAKSEFLACSCRNNAMDSGFEVIDQTYCENMHYECCKCSAVACVDFAMRIVNNEQ